MEAVRRPSRGLSGAAQRVLPQRGVVDLARLTAASADLDDKQARRWDGFVSDVAAAAEVATRGDASALVGFLVDEVGLASSARTLDSGRSDASRSSHHDDLVAVRRAAALHPALDDFLPWLARAVAQPSNSDGVTLSSVHRVKGREWSRVLVFGVDRGAMPHELADDLEEERRVFHVALTRAREEAVVLADAARPSRFLAELTGSAPVTEAPPQPTPLPEADDGGLPDPELAAALRAWRLETSRRLGVPAYVVFNDRTLDEIARLRPATERALISIHGIGPRKLEDHGDEILGLVAEHAVGAPEGAAQW